MNLYKQRLLCPSCLLALLLCLTTSPASAFNQLAEQLDTTEPPPTPGACGRCKCKDGLPGPPGRDGRDGMTVVGPEGPPGRNGFNGTSGRDGRDGVVGRPGPKGNQGDQGLPGREGGQGVPGIDCDNLSIKNDINKLRSRVIDLELKIPLIQYLKEAVDILQRELNDTQDTLDYEIERVEKRIDMVNASRIPGPRGLPGPKGDRGPQGNNGQRGTRGLRGLQGVQGVPGDKGDRGEKGERGPKGDKGDDGISGVSGCHHKVIKSSLTSKHRVLQVQLDGPTPGQVIVGVSCASQGRLGPGNLSSTARGGYICSCPSRNVHHLTDDGYDDDDKRWWPGTSSGTHGGPNPQKRVCVLHYWQCPAF